MSKLSGLATRRRPTAKPGPPVASHLHVASLFATFAVVAAITVQAALETIRLRNLSPFAECRLAESLGGITAVGNGC